MPTLPRRPDTTPGAQVFLVWMLVAGEIALAAFVAVSTPTSLLAFSVLLAMQAVAVVALVSPRLAVIGFLGLIGLTPDGWFAQVGIGGDMVAPQKLMAIALAGLLIARFGLRIDLANPTFPYALIFVTGLGRGLGLGLGVGDSARSFIGMIAPWSLGFVRMPLYIATTFIAMVELLPLINVIGGLLAEITGVRSMFDLAGRLVGLKNGPTLGHFCLWAMAASTMELLRTGRRRHLILLGVNTVLLLASGARAPTAYAVLLCAICLLSLRAPRFGIGPRAMLVAAGGLVVAIGFVFIAHLGPIRALDTGSADQLSGRDLIWPIFQDAIAASPYFGHGVGAGKNVLDINDQLAQLLGTNAAHNEYLRIAAEGGLIGASLLFIGMAAWCMVLSRSLGARERFMLRLAFIMFALLSITDNTLISTTALVFFSWVAAVSARGRAEAELRAAGLRP